MSESHSTATGIRHLISAADFEDLGDNLHLQSTFHLKATYKRQARIRSLLQQVGREFRKVPFLGSRVKKNLTFTKGRSNQTACPRCRDPDAGSKPPSALGRTDTPALGILLTARTRPCAVMCDGGTLKSDVQPPNPTVWFHFSPTSKPPLVGDVPQRPGSPRACLSTPPLSFFPLYSLSN